MASLTFNPSKPRAFRPHPQSPQPISRSTFFKVSSPCPPLLHKIPIFAARTSHIRSISAAESPVSPATELSPVEGAVGDGDELGDPFAELSYLDTQTDPESISEWQLDFCSRPILDIRGKKIWELVVCVSSLSPVRHILP